MKRLMRLFMFFGFFSLQAAGDENIAPASLRQSFSTFLLFLPNAPTNGVFVEAMGKVSFPPDFEKRATMFIDFFLRNPKNIWQAATDHAALDFAAYERSIWIGVIGLELVATTGMFYFIYPWRGWNALGVDFKAAYLKDRMQQCFSLPITTIGLFAIYRIIATTLQIRKHPKLMAERIQQWLLEQKDTVPQELNDWYTKVSSYNDAALALSLANGTFSQSLWEALYKNAVVVDLRKGLPA